METCRYPKCNIFPELSRFKPRLAQLAEVSGCCRLLSVSCTGSGDANTDDGGSTESVPGLPRTLSKPAEGRRGMDAPSLSSMHTTVQGPYGRLDRDLPPLRLSTALARGYGLRVGMKPIRAC